jgi:hypothetical protein
VTLADAPRPPAGPEGARGAPLVGDLAHLQGLIGVLHRHFPWEPIDERERSLLVGATSASTAEQHLRAIGALLATLDSYLRGRRPHGERTHDPAPTPARDDVAPAPATSTGPGPALAAAVARYIARDLAARRLSEFTSAEGYRLARTLAGIGGVEAPIERLLAEASAIRLHPPPLTDAVSHSAG